MDRGIAAPWKPPVPALCPPAGDLAALISAARADPTAFGPLYDRYVDRVHAYLRAHTADGEEARDLTQQVFLRALDGLPRYRGGAAAFTTWLFRIARNAAGNARTRRRVTVALHLLPEGSHPTAPGDPEAAALRHEEAAQLRALVAALPPDKRELLALRFAAGLRVGEIATVLGASEAATRKRLARILQTLQEQYDERS